jgi:hypothetical protein
MSVEERSQVREVAVGIALANSSVRVQPEQVYSFIESEASGVQTYELVPPPGSLVAAAVDYYLILGAVGSAASIASLLWMAYDHFIAPTKADSSNAGIVVVLQKADGTSDQFWIGNTDDSQEAFVEEFSHKVETIRRADGDGGSDVRIVDEVRMGGLWVRRK